jgi:hypothetical protein
VTGVAGLFPLPSPAPVCYSSAPVFNPTTTSNFGTGRCLSYLLYLLGLLVLGTIYCLIKYELKPELPDMNLALGVGIAKRDKADESTQQQFRADSSTFTKSCP